jgi:glycosyltransferase involved in cell wall biosynthesis
MKNRPLLSVVVPSCSRVELYIKTINSLQQQTLTDFELIVSDDSNEIKDRQDIKQRLEKYQKETARRAKYIFTKPGLGQAQNTNQGLQVATGDLVRILHSDDILHPDCLAWECEAFQKYTPLSLLFHDCIPFKTEEEISWNTSPLSRLVEPYQYFEEFLSVSTALPSGTVFRRQVLQAVGGMRKDWSFLCDWEFFAKLLLWCGKKNELAAYSSTGLVGWRLHKESTTSMMWKNHYLEHQALMSEWKQNLPGEHSRLFEDTDIRKSFFDRGYSYCRQRLFEDCEKLNLRAYFQSIPWLIQNRCYGTKASRIIKTTVFQLRRRIRGKGEVRFQIKSVAKRDTAKSGLWIPDLTFSPFYSDEGDSPNDTLYIKAFDNRLNTWPMRERISQAKRIRINHICKNRFIGRSLLEFLKYVQVGTEVEFFFHDNEHMTWFGLKALLNQYAPERFEFVKQNRHPKEGTRLGHSQWTIRYRCIKPSAAWYNEPISGISIGVLTLGGRINELTALVRTAEKYCQFPFEIILISPKKLVLAGIKTPLKQIIFDEPDEYGWITRKKNLICSEAKYSDIIVFHDRYEFSPSFFDTFDQWGVGYGIASPKTILKDGNRALDWAVVRGSNYSWCEGGLLNYRDNSQYSYVPGGVTMVRKSFWEKFPWAEDLFWNEHEDVELSRRIQRANEFIYMFPGKIVTHQDRWINQNPLLPFNEVHDINKTY